jgi:hypothetical protein
VAAAAGAVEAQGSVCLDQAMILKFSFSGFACICRNITCGSSALIDRDHFPAHRRHHVLVEVRTEIHLAANDDGQRIGTAEVTPPPSLNPLPSFPRLPAIS